MVFKKGHKTWNKNLTKDNDERVKDYSIKLSRGLKGKRKMQENSNWKGGKTNMRDYILIKKPKHPYSKQNGYVYEHRLVMEKKIGRYTKSEEIIHHIDFDRTNNKIENLYLYKSRGEHNKIHKNNIPKLIVELYQKGLIKFKNGRYFLENGN
jgi:hypothetical protein